MSGPEDSANSDVRAMYDATAHHYDKTMDAEIDLPVYTDALDKLAKAVAGLDGPVVDVACGSGQMLQRYQAQFDPSRALVGFDLSPEMVAIAQAKLTQARVHVGDMRNPGITGAAALICWFALHHLPSEQVPGALDAWSAALRPDGRLSLATWEGRGLVDYGGEADLNAWRYDAETVRGWVEAAGFAVDRCVVLPVDGMPMDAVYLDAHKA